MKFSRNQVCVNQRAEQRRQNLEAKDWARQQQVIAERGKVLEKIHAFEAMGFSRPLAIREVVLWGKVAPKERSILRGIYEQFVRAELIANGITQNLPSYIKTRQFRELPELGCRLEPVGTEIPVSKAEIWLAK